MTTSTDTSSNSTSTPATPEHIRAVIDGYVRNTLLTGSDETLTGSTPLLEWGILTSMNTALLLAHVESQLGMRVPPMYITAAHFRDIDSIVELVTSLVVA